MESYKKKSFSSPNTHYGFYLMFGLITYFIWCDLNFFGELNAEQELGFNLANITQSFPSISIKLRMQDHFAHYIYLPFCQWVEDTFKISQVPGITPNVITAVHFTLAFCAGRVMAYPEVFFSKLAAIIYEVRTMLDTMDGVVYRAQSSLNTYVSGWGSYGFIIDGVADTVGGIFLTIALIYKFNKNRPFQNLDDISLMRKKHNFDPESSQSLLASDESISKENEDLYGLVRYSKKAVNFTIIFFTILVIMRSSLWDYFNHNYHNLFALRRQDVSLEKQWEDEFISVYKINKINAFNAMAQMTDVLIAKIVLGYLTSQKLSKTIDSFLGESEFLNTTNIDNNKERILNQLEDLNLLPSLEDILNDYFAYNQTSDVKSEKIFQLWRQLDIVLGQIRSLTLGKKKNSLLLDRKRKIVNGYNNHIPKRNIAEVNARVSIVPDCVTNVSNGTTNASNSATNVSNSATNVSNGVTTVLNCNTNVIDCVNNISDHITNVSDNVTNTSDHVSNVSNCATNVSDCVTNVLGSITNVSECAPIDQDASDVPQNHSEQSAITSKQINKLSKTKKSPKRKSTCPKKRVQLDSLCSSLTSNNLDPTGEFVDTEELPSREILQKRLSNDVWQTAGKLAQNINMIVGGDLNTLHLNSSRKDQLDFNEFINHITVEHDFSSLFAMIKDVPSPLPDIDDRAEHLNILQDYKYLEGFTSIQNESSIPENSKNVNSTNILETKNIHNDQTLNLSELDNLIAENEEHLTVATIQKDANHLVVNNSQSFCTIYNRENDTKSCPKPSIGFKMNNSYEDSSDLYKIELNLEKKDLVTQTNFNNSLQSSFEVSNDQLKDNNKKFVNSSYFLNGDSFMHFLTDVNCADPTNDASSQFHVNNFLNKAENVVPENLESSQLHVRNLNSELNSILESHIQVSVPHIQSNVQSANVQSSETLILSNSTLSFQNMYQPQETYLNLHELKPSSVHSPPGFSEYRTSINIRKQCLKELSIPTVSSNSCVDESVSIASDALLLLATSPIKLRTSKIPGFLHPPNEISALLKSFISNDSLIHSDFDYTQSIQTVENDNKIEHTSQLPSYSPIKIHDSQNTSYSTIHVGNLISTNDHKKKSRNERNNQRNANERNNQRNTNERNNQGFVPRVFNFVRSPKKASPSKSKLRVKGKKLSSEDIAKTKCSGISSVLNNSLSLKTGVSSCSNDSLSVIPAVSFVDYCNIESEDNPIISLNDQKPESNIKIQSSDSICNKKSLNLSKIISINQEIPILTLNKEILHNNKDSELFETPEKITNLERKQNFTNSPKGLSSSKESFAERFKKLQAKESLKKQNVTVNSSSDHDNSSTVKMSSFLSSPSQSNIIINRNSPSPVFDSKLLSSPIQGHMYRIKGNTISPLPAIGNETGSENVCSSESFVSISPVIPYKQPKYKQPKNSKPLNKVESNEENCKSVVAQENTIEGDISTVSTEIATTPTKIATTPAKSISPQHSYQKQLTKKEIKVRFNFKSPKKTKKVVNKTLQQHQKAKPSKTVDASNDLSNELFVRKQKTLFNRAAKINVKLYSPVKDLFNCSKKNTNLLLVPYNFQIKNQDLLYVVDTSFQNLIASSNYELEIFREPLDSINSLPLAINLFSSAVQNVDLTNKDVSKVSMITGKQSSNSEYLNQSAKTENEIYNSRSYSFTENSSSENFNNEVSTVQPSNALSTSEILGTQSKLGDVFSFSNKQSDSLCCSTSISQSQTIDGTIEPSNEKSDLSNKKIVGGLSENFCLGNNLKFKEILVPGDSYQPIATFENNKTTNNESLTTKSDLNFKVPDLNKKIVSTGKRSFYCDEDFESNPKKQKEDKLKRKINKKRKLGIAVLKSIDLEQFLSKINYSS